LKAPSFLVRRFQTAACCLVMPLSWRLRFRDVLADPILELRDSNGMLLLANDNGKDNPVPTAQLTAHGLAPRNPKESGIFASLPPDAFTVSLAGKNGGTGIGLVEIYNVL